MDHEQYDRKLNEMQKYVPFLDRIIRNLKNSKNDNRETQLIKMETIYDVLINKDKKITMETLLKCELALAKLHSKVEKCCLISTSERDNVAASVTPSSFTASTSSNQISSASPTIGSPSFDIQNCGQLFDYMFPNHDQSKITKENAECETASGQSPNTKIPSSPPPEIRKTLDIMPHGNEVTDQLPLPTISDVLPTLSLNDINNLLNPATTVNSLPNSETDSDTISQKFPSSRDPRNMHSLTTSETNKCPSPDPPNPEPVTPHSSGVSLEAPKASSSKGIMDNTNTKDIGHQECLKIVDVPSEASLTVKEKVLSNPFLDSIQTPIAYQRRHVDTKLEIPIDSNAHCQPALNECDTRRTLRNRNGICSTVVEKNHSHPILDQPEPSSETEEACTLNVNNPRFTIRTTRYNSSIAGLSSSPSKSVQGSQSPTTDYQTRENSDAISNQKASEMSDPHARPLSATVVELSRNTEDLKIPKIEKEARGDRGRSVEAPGKEPTDQKSENCAENCEQNLVVDICSDITMNRNASEISSNETVHECEVTLQPIGGKESEKLTASNATVNQIMHTCADTSQQKPASDIPDKTLLVAREKSAESITDPKEELKKMDETEQQLDHKGIDQAKNTENKQTPTLKNANEFNSNSIENVAQKVEDDKPEACKSLGRVILDSEKKDIPTVGAEVKDECFESSENRNKIDHQNEKEKKSLKRKSEIKTDNCNKIKTRNSLKKEKSLPTTIINSDILLKNIVSGPRRKRISTRIDSSPTVPAVKKLKSPAVTNVRAKQSIVHKTSDGSQESSISSTTTGIEVDKLIAKKTVTKVSEEKNRKLEEAGSSKKMKELQDGLESDLRNQLKPETLNTSTVLQMLEKLLDENKFKQIKTILSSDTPPEPSSGDSVEVVADVVTKSKPKPTNVRKKTEIDRLNEDVHDMFMRGGVLSGTGRRICKQGNESNVDEMKAKTVQPEVPHRPNSKSEIRPAEPEPIPKDIIEDKTQKSAGKRPIDDNDEELQEEVIFAIEVGQNSTDFTVNENQSTTKNINPAMHCKSIYCNKCALCNFTGRFIHTHYLYVHKSEVFTSRLPPEVLERLRSNKGQRAVQVVAGDTNFSSHSFACPFCDMVSAQDRVSWQNHFSTHTGEYRMKCSACNLSRNKTSEIRHHIENDCPNGRVINMREPMESKIAVYAYVCDLCNYVQMSRTNITDHLLTQHNCFKDTITKITLLSTKQNDMECEEDLGPPVLEPEITVHEYEEIDKLEELVTTKRLVVRLKRLKLATIREATRAQDSTTSTENIYRRDSSTLETCKNNELETEVNSGAYDHEPVCLFIKSETDEPNTADEVSNSISGAAQEPEIDILNTTNFQNIYPGMHTQSQYTEKCLLCSIKGKHLGLHYINVHKCEVPFSRLPPETQNELVLNSSPSETNRTIAGKCPFCDIEKCWKKRQLIDHFATHTGEYDFQCSGCQCKKNKLKNMTRHITECVPGSEIERVNRSVGGSDILYGYICELCNYIQMHRENVVKHMATQHNSRDDSIRKVALMKFVAIEKNLVVIETVQVQNVYHEFIEDDATMDIFKDDVDGSPGRSKINDLPVQAFDVPGDDQNRQNVEYSVNVNSIENWKINCSNWSQQLSNQYQTTGEMNETITAPTVRQDDVEGYSIIDMGHCDPSEMESFRFEENISNFNDEIKAPDEDAIIVSDDEGTVPKTRGMFYSDSDPGVDNANDWQDIEIESDCSKPQYSKESYSTPDTEKFVETGINNVPGTSSTATSAGSTDCADKLINILTLEKDIKDEKINLIGADDRQPSDVPIAKPFLKIRHLPGDSLSVSSSATKSMHHKPLKIFNVVSLNRNQTKNEVTKTTKALPQPKFRNFSNTEKVTGKSPSIKIISVSGAESKTSQIRKVTNMPQSIKMLNISNRFKIKTSSIQVASTSTNHQDEEAPSESNLSLTHDMANTSTFLSDGQLVKADEHSYCKPTVAQSQLNSIRFPTSTQNFKIIGSTKPDGQKLNMTECKPTILKPWALSKSEKSVSNVARLLHKLSLVALCKCMANNCEFTANTYESMTEHLMCHAQQAKFENGESSSYDWLECCYCSNIWTTEVSALILHIREKHANDIYQCPYCFYRSCEGYNVIVHMHQYHPVDDIMVYVCSGKKALLSNEMATAEEGMKRHTKEIQCTECSTSFVNPLIFAMHIKFHATIPDKPDCYTCFFCIAPNNIIPKEEAVKHLMCRHNIACYQCVYCSFASDQKFRLNRHMANCHASNMRFCCIRIEMLEHWDNREIEIHKCYDNKTVLALLKGPVSKDCLRVLDV